MGLALGMPLGEALALPSGMGQGAPLGSDPGGTSDWSLWWRTFEGVAGARLHIWRCSAAGLNVGEALIVMTVDDARRLRLDDHAVALAYLTTRWGAGRYRLTPRSDQGTKLPGTQSLIAVIDEDTPMHVTMHTPAPAGAPFPAGTALDRDTAIEIERMRLTAEMERERESRRERHRDAREERRREKEVDRERRRDEDRKRRDEDDRRRAERDAQTQTMMMQVLKEMAASRGSGKDDALVAAILAKVGQPDPLVLKLLDTHGKREEMTDFFKVQAESMRMASTLQTDSLKQVMVASQEVQGQLMRQAAEVAAQRDGGDGWAGIGSVLSATASIVAALRGGAPGASPAAPVPMPVTPLPMVDRRPVMVAPRPRPALAVAPPALPPSGQPDPVGESLRQVRAVHRGGQGDNDTTLRQVIAGLPPALSHAIRAGDVAAIQREVMPAVQADPTLGEWLSQPGVGDWLTSYLQRLRVELSGGMEAHATALPPVIHPHTSDEDPIV